MFGDYSMHEGGRIEPDNTKVIIYFNGRRSVVPLAAGACFMKQSLSNEMVVHSENPNFNADILACDIAHSLLALAKN